MIGAVKAPVEAASPLHALAAPNREAMAWISANAPASAEFLVVTGSQWFLDADAEWFPVLAGHHSLSTVQGYEWLGKAAWEAQDERNNALQVCAYATKDCLSEWTEAAGLQDAWIYVPAQTISTTSPTGDCCAGLRASLATDPGSPSCTTIAAAWSSNRHPSPAIARPDQLREEPDDLGRGQFPSIPRPVAVETGHRKWLRRAENDPRDGRQAAVRRIHDRKPGPVPLSQDRITEPRRNEPTPADERDVERAAGGRGCKAAQRTDRLATRG